MGSKPWIWWGLAAVAALGLWLLLGSGRVLGHDLGAMGPSLLIVSAWAALHRASKVVPGALDGDVSPGEWKAWIGLVFMAAAVLYLALKLPLLAGDTLAQSPHTTAVIRNLVLLLVAWIVLSHLVMARWKGRVQQDERDREIESRASEWGRGAVVFGVVTAVVTLGFSPPDRLLWATHSMIANLLILLLMIGWLLEYAATAVMYVRDRRLA